MLAGRLTGRPTTITEYFPGYYDRRGRRLTGQLVFCLADAFICDSQAHSDLVNRWLFRRHRRARVIPNGIPAPVATRTNAQMRRELRLPDDRGARVVGQVSRLVSYKGQRVLLKAAKRVIARVPDTYFVLTGYPGEDSTYPDTLRRDAEELGIADRVRLVSWPGSIGDVWELIDVQAHASLHDSLPVSVAEGMSFGKPAVVTNVGGIEEMVLHEQTGLVVPMNNPDALAGGLERLLQEPATDERLGMAARQRLSGPLSA